MVRTLPKAHPWIERESRLESFHRATLNFLLPCHRSSEPGCPPGIARHTREVRLASLGLRDPAGGNLARRYIKQKVPQRPAVPCGYSDEDLAAVRQFDE